MLPDARTLSSRRWIRISRGCCAGRSGFFLFTTQPQDCSANLFPGGKKFAVYPVRILPSASETLADGKLLLCRRQIKNLPSASAPLAIGKIYV